MLESRLVCFVEILGYIFMGTNSVIFIFTNLYMGVGRGDHPLKNAPMGRYITARIAVNTSQCLSSKRLCIQTPLSV